MPSAPRSRPERSQPYPSESGANAGPSRKSRPTEQRDPSGLPGISKIKASIRQTKRLLAKDTLEPGLRIATQRRLTSQQADLARAERRELEKKNGGKYHMVKFFERQKLTRLIKRLLSQSTQSNPTTAPIFRDLEEARIMLNYVVHYPNEKKYISLFPAGEKIEIPAKGEEVDVEGMEKTERLRFGMLLEVRGLMDRGEISSKPEEGEKAGRREKITVGREAHKERGGIGKEDKKDKSDKSSPKPVVEDADEFFESE